MENTVRTHILPIGDFAFTAGVTLPNVQLAYETYGTLNADKSNAVLLFHALTGSHHAHGWNETLPEAGQFWQPEYFEGWWDLMIGPGKPLDTDKFFIICINYLGSCYGSTGPTSPAPDGKPWGSRFPLVTAADQAHAQIKVLDHFGIDRFAIVGPSLGGQLALTLTALYPQRIKSELLIGTSYETPVDHKLSVFEQIMAIELDAAYQGGMYALNKQPWRGVALARIICHKMFVYQKGLSKRAKKALPDRRDMLTWYTPTQNTESYMLYQGVKFSKRFDANAYIRIMDMWAKFDLPAFAGKKNLNEVCRIYAEHKIPFMIFSISTDCCFTPRDIARFARCMQKNGVQAGYKCIKSQKGHDSFLLEPELYAAEIAALLG